MARDDGAARGGVYLDELAQRKQADSASGQPEGNGAPVGRKVSLRRADSIKPEAIRWLWPGYLARGKLHLIAGAAGTGKTTIALALAATISNGGQWPDGTFAEVGDALIWSGEDSCEDTLIPRLMAMGADLSRILIVSTVDQGGHARPFDPAVDFPALQEAVAALPNLRLIIVDPIVSAIAGDSHKNSETRRGLQPLVEIAQTLDCVLLGVTHFSKATNGRVVTERVTGSLAFGAVARIVLATGNVSGDRGGGRVLARAKSNIGPDGGGFSYRVAQVDIVGIEGVVASKVEWTGPISGSAQEILDDAELNARVHEEAGPRALVRAMLADGRRPAREVLDEGAKRGFNERSIQRAREKMGAETRKKGMKGGHEWYLPEDDNLCREEPDAIEVSSSSPSSSSKMTGPTEDDVDDTKSCCETPSPFAEAHPMATDANAA